MKEKGSLRIGLTINDLLLCLVDLLAHLSEDLLFHHLAMISYLTTNSTRDRTPIENQNIKKVESPPSHQSSRCRSPLRVILGNVDINTRIDVKTLETKIQIKINLCHSLGERSTFQ